MMSTLGTVLVPILIHLLVSNLVVVFFASYLDPAMCTALAALLVFPVVWWMYRKDMQGVEKPGHKWWSYLPLIPLGVCANQIFSYILVWLAVPERFSNAAQESLLSSGVLVQLIGIGILAPVMEEYLFRGLVYRRLKLHLPGWAAVLLGAGIFAVYHGNMPQILFAFPMALIMIWSYERWETLAAPIVFHMAANISTILLNLI